MSTTIDQRVVEMRFDNKQFERGVSDTMSTLEKLKQKLNFNGAVKGVENVNSAARGVNANMSSLGGAVEQVSLKFSALQVMGTTALVRLTNSAITAGTRIAKALTIEPITTGFQEYETQINAVQTILANTSHAGTTIDDVNKALDDLNKYADQTIYNFTQMTRNIGTFTAAGVDLETSTSAIKGIANLAAVSGSTSQQASTAMYQLSQALAAGRVSLMDWNSVVNAGMGGKVFQDALTRTSEVMGTGAAAAIEKYGSFRESLTRGEWLTTDVLTETLNQFTMAAEEGSEEWHKFKEELKEKGYTEDQAVEILKMANTATNAATKVKTFTQLWDVLKESAQSGWSQSWKLIIGDFEEAKNLLTPISESLTGLINRMSDFRNAILKSALGRTFGDLGDKFKVILKPAEKVMAVTKDTVEAVADLGAIVDEVIGGKFGNGEERYNALTKAGINYYEVQNKVNEKLGCAKRYTQEQIDAQDKLLGVQTETVEKTEEQSDTTVELTDAQKKQLIEMSKLNDSQLKQKGYTWEQIEALRELQKVAESLGIPFDKFINQLDEIDGRWLLINGFKNIGDTFADIGRVFGKAWKEIFPEHSVEYFADKLFNLLGSFHKFTAGLADAFYVIAGYKGEAQEPIYKLTDAGEKLVRTFKGILAIVDIVATVIGGGFKIAVKVVTELLSRFGLNILDVTAAIADAIVAFRDWIDDILNVSSVVDVLVPLVKTAAKFITTLVNAVRNSTWFNTFCYYVGKTANALAEMFERIPDTEPFQNLIAVLSNTGKAISGWIDSLKGSENIPADIIAGLVKGITSGVPKVISAVFDLAKSIITGICEVLGIESPSKVMIAIGGFIIAGLIQGMAGGEGSLMKLVENLTTNFGDTLKAALMPLAEMVDSIISSFWDYITDDSGAVKWGQVIGDAAIISLLISLTKFSNLAESISGVFDGVKGLITSCTTVVTEFGKLVKAYRWEACANAILKLALGIALLAGAVWILAQIEDPWQLIKSVGALIILAGVMVGLAWAMNKFSSIDISLSEKKITGLKTSLLQIALAIAVLAFVVKVLNDIPDPKQGFIGLAAIAAGMIVFMAALGGISRYSKDVGYMGGVMLKLALAMALMVGVIKLANGLDAGEIANGILFAGAFAIFVMAIASVANKAGEHVSKVGGLMIKLAFAMGLMVGVCKLAGMLDANEILKGAAFAVGFTILVRSLAKAVRMDENQKIAGLAGLVIAVSFSMALMVGVCKLVNLLTVGEMLKGAVFATGFGFFVKCLVGILSISKEQEIAKISGVILAIAITMGVMAVLCRILGDMDLADLAKGVVAVSAIGLVLAAMIAAMRGANNVKASITALAAAIGTIAASVAVLAKIEDPSALYRATTCLGILMGMFALISKCSGQIDKAWGSLIVMTIAVGVIASVLYLLANNLKDADAAIKAASAIGILMGAMALSLKIVGGLSSINSTVIGAMAGLVLILYGLTGVFGLLKQMEVQPSLEAALSLSVLLLALSGVTAILTAIGPAAAGVLPGLGALGIVVVGIGALLVALAGLNALSPDLQNWLDTGIVILEKIASGLGRAIGAFIGGIGNGLMDQMLEMCGTLMAVVNKLVVISNIAKIGINTEGFDKIGELLTLLGDIALLTVGTSLADWFNGKLSDKSTMEKFETDSVAFFKAIQAIGEASTGVTIDEDGFNNIIKIAEQLVDFQNSIKMDALDKVISWLSGKTDLSMFGAGAKAFVESMVGIFQYIGTFSITGTASHVFDTIIVGATRLVELQNSIDTGALDKVISWLSGKTDLSMFGTGAKAFVESMVGIFQYIGTFSITGTASHVFDTIIVGATRLVELQNSIDTGALDKVISWLSGKTDLSMFAEGAKSFITSMVNAFGAIGEDVTLNEDTFELIMSAATKLLEFQETIDTDMLDKIIGWFGGQTELGEFGDNVKLFAEGMAKVKEAVGEDGISETAVQSMIDAGTAIAGMTDILPEESWFDGKMNLTEFSDYITDFATAMGTFGEKAGGIDPDAVAMTVSTAERIKSLIESLVGLDTSGLQTFTGIGTGGIGADGAAYDIAKTIVEFSDKVKGIDTTAVSTSVTAAATLKRLIAGLVGLDTSGIENFKPEKIGSAIKAYDDKIDGFDVGAVSSSITAANKLKTFISGLSSFDGSGVGSFKKALNELATVDVDKVVKAFSGAAPKLESAGSKMMDGLTRGMTVKFAVINSTITKLLIAMNDAFSMKLPMFERAGGKTIVKMAKGMIDQKSSTKSAVRTCLSSAISGTTVYYTGFYNAGSYLVTGFANGISENSYRAVAKAVAMAEAAIKAAREALKINSPSKVFAEIGGGVPEGFAMGIEKMSSLINAPLNDMSSLATKSVSDTVSKLAAAIGSDMDVQPTIRPVLDLSNIRSGSGAISSMLGVGSSVGVLANVGAISSSMNRRSQNASNDDVVSAINRLDKHLANVGNTTYSINGITYDDGSNIATAIRDLTRYARIEGRV